MVEKKKTGPPRGRRSDTDGEATEQLLARMRELEERIARLEAARDAAVAGLIPAAPVAPVAPLPAPAVQQAPTAPASAHEEVTEEIMTIIAASVAAFLGERAHVKQVRLVASEAWAQQGRVSVMASHRWAVHR